MNEQQTEPELPSRGLMLELAALGVVLAGVGVLITGDFVKLWPGTWYFQGLGYALVDVGLSAFLVFIFVEELLSRDRRLSREREAARWDAVRDRVNRLIETTLSGIAAETINATNPIQSGFADPEATNEQILEKARNSILNELEKMTEDTALLRNRVERAATNILDRPHGDLYAQRAGKLGNLQQRYWSHFLNPQTVAYLIDLEEALETLDLHTKITARERQHPAKAGSLEEALRETGMYDQKVYRDLQTILKLITQGVHEKRLEIL